MEYVQSLESMFELYSAEISCASVPAAATKTLADTMFCSKVAPSPLLASIRLGTRRFHAGARLYARPAHAKKPPLPGTSQVSQVRHPAEQYTFELYQVNPQRVTDFKFKFLTGCFIIVVAGANISFAFYDWHQVDENGAKTYANQAWRLACTNLTLLSAGGVFWAAWRLSSSNVKRIHVTMPDASLKPNRDPRKALLNRYSQARFEIETFLPPHPFSSRANKIYSLPMSELQLDGPLSQTQKPWHPRGFHYSDSSRQRKGRDASHVPISRVRRSGEKLPDYVKWLRPIAGEGVLPPPSAFHSLTPFAVAKDGKWDTEHLDELEQAMLELQARRS